MPPTRFVADSALGFLTRRLRFLGYDVVAVRGARLEELFEIARRDGRVVLTASGRHPRAFGDVPVLRVARERPEDAVRSIAASHPAPGPPFSRCPNCNHPLERRLPMQAAGEVPGRVLRRATVLTYCPDCGQWFWDGTHVARLRSWLERVLGRPLEDGPPAS